jgi:hypothetical protein
MQIQEISNKYNADWNVMEYIYVPNLKAYIPLHSKIQTGPTLSERTQLHERIHEYINSDNPKQQKIRNRDQTSYIYTGDKTVDLVLTDSKSDTKLYKSIVFMKETGKYGLIMQDDNHLGDWGPESAPSSYQHITFNIGKYTMSVVNELGYYMT